MPHHGRHIDSVIVIPDEDDVNLSEISPLEQGLRDLHHARNEHRRVPVIDLTQDEEEQRNVLQYEIQIIDQLDGIGTSDSSRRRPVAPQRNPPIPTHLRIYSVRYRGTLIKLGTVVEVAQRPRDEYSWQFLHVLDIYTQAQSGIVLRGIRLTRHRYMRGLLPRMKNEVCALYDIDKADKRPGHVQALVEISVADVIRTRALTRTNAAFPAYRFHRWQWKDNEEIENKAVLVQRWNYCRYWPTAIAMASKKSYSGSVVRLRYHDIQDKDLRVSDNQLRNEFRSGIIRGGSFKGGQACIPTIDLDAIEDDGQAIMIKPNQRYTVDDMFCGAGGGSCGIRRAGLQIRLACDLDTAACKSYQKNFPEASLQQMNIFDLIEQLEYSTDHSDLMHISPPCQVWSPAHTNPGKNDDANVAALFACAEVLERRRPRISTGEQTFGLLFDRNEQFFNALIGQYTALGYSFSWDVLHFKEYGVPSIRRRLIWIASCPGEALPPFPMPTHSEARGGLPPPVTLREVFLSIRPRDPLHDVAGMLCKARNSAKFPKNSYDDRTQIGTVTTAGSDWGHPSGQRNFTLRELACIQGFPRSHKFIGTMTQISRQIGNAFPPVVVETLYRHLWKWLLEQDRVVAYQSELISTTQQDIIILYDDDNDDNDEVMVIASRSAKPGEPILTEDDDDENFDDQGSSRSRERSGNRVEDAILIDDSGDVLMSDLTQAECPPNLSRESSRTLSMESLRSHMEIETEVIAPCYLQPELAN
ncbi:S-adenosyl-L-methionine-dependent methyltransferase [Xylariaceae sp. AK1471]|nr:S-adenosyl-L-methionine-dependent methyltransferase [Xylariaceae sp. AK1471]